MTERPSWAAATVRDVTPARTQPRAEALQQHAAGRRLADVVAAVTLELPPVAHHFTVTVETPTVNELREAHVWLDAHHGQLAVSDELGVLTQEELPGWIAEWQLTATASDGRARALAVVPQRVRAELLVDVADWLQNALADQGLSAPAPVCPGHDHPARPVVHRGQAGWTCPATGSVRGWSTIDTAAG